MISRRSFLQGGGSLALSGIFAELSGCGPKQSKPLSNGTAALPITPLAKFSDITEVSGLSFTQSDGGCGERYFVEQIASGAALFDSNGNGFLDIYFPQPKSLGICKGKNAPLQHHLYLNDGKGRFNLAPKAFGGIETAYGIAAAIGDYNNDGYPDIYVACYGQNTLFRNRGDGTFEDVTAKAGVALGGFSSGAVWFDYDGDGFLDLFVTRYCEWSVENNQKCIASNGLPDFCHPSLYQPATNALFHNNGDGTFTEVTKEAGFLNDARRSLAAAAADFDGDGRLDLFVANDLGANTFYHNMGNGKFEEIAIQENVAFGATGMPQSNMGIAVGDYDDDGDLDMVITTFADEPRTLYKNDGSYFTDLSAVSGIGPATRPYLAFGTGFLDTRNSGDLDLFCANGHIFPYAYLKDSAKTYKERNQLLLNDGKGHYTDSPDSLPADDVRVHRGAYFGDIDNDGRIDILVTAENDRPTLLHNDSKAGNWLLIKLITHTGCSTPIGTKCYATIGGRKKMRVVLGGGSYAGDSDYRVHFGLGQAKAVDTLEIHWLSGRKQTLTAVAANQILTVKEA